MNKKDKEFKRRLIAKRKNVKSKLDLLKQGEMIQESAFLPITKHLKNIETKLENKDNSNKKIKYEKDDYNDDDDDSYDSEFIKNENISDVPFEKSGILRSSTPKQMFQKRLENRKEESPLFSFKKKILDAIEEDERKEENLGNSSVNLPPNEQSFLDYLEQYDPLPRKYIHDMLTGDPNEFDRKTGVRHDAEAEKFYIGNSQLHIDGLDVIVKNKKYKGTPGLYELLFKKNPINYTETDLSNYKDIVQKTNAHKRHYQHNKQVAGSRSKKYQKIIAPLIGKGMLMEVTDNPINYIYWDDPNELVDRLRLLLASQEAGHTGHVNEINSIIEELREANIIE